jgi:hypothetical protein
MLPMKRLVAVSCILIMLAAIFVVHDLCSNELVNTPS